MRGRVHTDRYLDLVEALGRQMSHARGWKGRAAEMLGIDASHLSRILKGERQVGWDLAERAAKNLGIDLSYFLTDKPGQNIDALLRGSGGEGGAGDDAGESIKALVDKFSRSWATVDDVYALARAVVGLPVFVQAQAIARTPRPRTEQEVGALFISASRLVDALHREELGRPIGASAKQVKKVKKRA